MKKKTSSSKLQEFHRLKEEAVTELLEKRKSLKQELRQEVARLENALEENATELLELGHKVKDAAVSSSAGKNLRLPSDQIKEFAYWFSHSLFDFDNNHARDESANSTTVYRKNLHNTSFATF